jgi:hypothetical protein
MNGKIGEIDQQIKQLEKKIDDCMDRAERISLFKILMDLQKEKLQEEKLHGNYNLYIMKTFKLF